MPAMITAAWLNWGLVALSLLLLVGYELRAHRIGGRDPRRMARYAHARLRTEWVRALSGQPGFEIVAVQALRNSLMSATISASTAALAVMGAVTLSGGSLAANIEHWSRSEALHTALQALLVMVLFASYVCSAMAMRYFGHASFVMSMPVASPERQPLNAVAAEHVRRAGLLYSWGLRLFLMVASIVAGIVHPWAMLPVTLLLLVALHYFDRPADLEVD
jgi:uncharacterized membrane protein